MCRVSSSPSEVKTEGNGVGDPVDPFQPTGIVVAELCARHLGGGIGGDPEPASPRRQGVAHIRNYLPTYLYVYHPMISKMLVRYAVNDVLRS